MPAQPTGAVEYIDYISVEGLDSPNECPRYDTKQSDDEAAKFQVQKTKCWSISQLRRKYLRPANHYNTTKHLQKLS